MKVYIAGPISGDPNYKEKFERVANELQAEGHAVLNPAALPEGMFPKDYMRICFAMIDVADKVHFLPGWYASAGARLEMDYCSYIGKPVILPHKKGMHNATCDAAVSWLDSASYADQLNVEADYLISHGVTFVTDKNVTDKNVGKWIPVRERFPEPHRSIEMYFPSKEMVCLGCYEQLGPLDIWCIYTPNSNNVCQQNPTHWRYRDIVPESPEPPKEG